MKLHKRPVKRSGLFARLRNCQAGNASLIIAASVVPLIGMIGGGFDMGRMYASKTRLQHACDAAVLAGRKAMVGNNFTAANKSTAERFFKFNFPNGKYGTSFPVQKASGAIPGIAFDADSGRLAAKAQAIVPMTLMSMFSSSERLISAECKAELNLPNSDIMFVLDTTGSMLGTNPGDSATRIESLRTAVGAFHSAITNANAAGARIRYGFVPYSSNVNVGYLLKPEWMVDNWTYQSRVADGIETENNAAATGTYSYNDGWTPVSGNWADIAPVQLPAGSCTEPADTVEWGGSVVETRSEAYAGPPSGTKTIEVRQWTANGIDYWLDRQTQSLESSIVTTGCTLRGRRYNNYVEQYNFNTIPNETAASSANVFYWLYRPVTYNVAALRGLTSGGSIEAQVGTNHSMRTIAWQGCIEERQTVRADDYDPIPAGAYDMDIDLVPDPGIPATQWAPALPHLVFTRTDLTNADSWDVNPVRSKYNFSNLGDSGWASCPSRARKLAEIDASMLTAYMNSLQASGPTYHDIGMIWGARLLSPNGLFANENSSAPNGNAIARHLIFMTDGETDTQPFAYDAYGLPSLDRRRVMNPTDKPTKDDQDELVAMRTEAICRSVKAKGITIWVIAFGTDLTSMLSDCASEGKAFQANNAAQLNGAFDEIAAGISHLRLTR